MPYVAEVFCFVSPVLGQLRMSSSKSSIQQWTHSCGGAGLVALEVGMGKTACAVAVTQLNPPDAEWRKNRAHQTPRAHDYLCETARAVRDCVGLTDGEWPCMRLNPCRLCCSDKSGLAVHVALVMTAAMPFASPLHITSC